MFLHVAATPINIPELRETNGLVPRLRVVPETHATRKLFGSEQSAGAGAAIPASHAVAWLLFGSHGSALRGHGSEKKVQSRLKPRLRVAGDGASCYVVL